MRRCLRSCGLNAGVPVAVQARVIGRGDRYGAKWELTALEAIGMVEVEGVDEEIDPHATRTYRLAARYQGVYESVASFFAPLSNREETA
jgi:hypothetical protein